MMWEDLIQGVSLGYESGRHLYSTTSEHVRISDFLGRRPEDLFVVKQQRKLYVFTVDCWQKLNERNEE